MKFRNQGVVAAVFAAVIYPSMSHAQEPAWSFQLLGSPPTIVATTGSTAFDRAIQSNFGLPQVAGLPTVQFTWIQGLAPTPGKIEIGGIASDTDDPATGSSIFVLPGSIDNVVGTLPLNDDSIPNGAADFFEQNTTDFTQPVTGNPTWALTTIGAGNSAFLDLGTLDVSKLLAYYDAQGPGTYTLTLNYGLAGYNASNGDALDPDALGNEIPRIPGPPSLKYILNVQAQTPPPPPPTGTPEPGSVATIAALAAAGVFAVRRRRVIS